MLLTPPQAQILEAGLLSSGFSCVLQLPTGSGKTWLAEQAIRQTVGEGHRAIYVAATRALAEELYARWLQWDLGRPIGIFTGDYSGGGRSYPVSFTDAAVLIVTPERLDAYTRNWRSHWNWMPEVNLVVVDEIHLLGEGLRGARLEGALSRLRRLNPFARVIGLSATLGNREELAEWLQGLEFSTSWRPFPLQWRISRYRHAKDKPGLLIQEVHPVVSRGGQSLVFVHSRRRAEELSDLLLQEGIACAHHHAGLSHTERSTIEMGFRSGNLHVLITTGTLEVGINVPASQVILYDLQAFDGSEFRPLSVIKVWQRGGRAGRLGQELAGEIVLMAPAWDRFVDTYQLGRFERIRSPLQQPTILAEQIMAEVGSGLARTRDQLKNALAESLAAFQNILPPLNPVIDEMCAAGLLREACDNKDSRTTLQLQPTRLGRAVVRHMVAPGTILLFRRIQLAQPRLTYFDVLLTLCSSSDCQPILLVNQEEVELLSSTLREEYSYLCSGGSENILGQLDHTPRRILSAFKMALVLLAWSRCGSIEEVANRFNCYRFEVAALRDAAQRLVEAWYSIADYLSECSQVEMTSHGLPNLKDCLRALRTMLVAGIDERQVSLTLIKGLGPQWVRKLSQNGYKDIEDLAQAEPAQLFSLGAISEKRANEWISAAQEFVTTHTYRFFETEGPAIQVKVQSGGIRTTSTGDRYRNRRSLDLIVSPRGSSRYLVTGGLDPHEVTCGPNGYSCDCPDFYNGFQCKHVLAVARYSVKHPAHLMDSAAEPNDFYNTWDLNQLWLAASK